MDMIASMLEFPKHPARGLIKYRGKHETSGGEMSIKDEFKNFTSDLTSQLSLLGQELRTITHDALEEVRRDPVRYAHESIVDLSAMGLLPYHSDYCGARPNRLPRGSIARVVPTTGSILYTDLLERYVQHSGVYVGDNRIVELNRHGDIRIVSPREFISAGTGRDIYVSCRRRIAVGSTRVAGRALEWAGKRRSYHFLLDNCHQFSSGCLTGDFENSDNFLWMLKASATQGLGVDSWCIWTI